MTLLKKNISPLSVPIIWATGDSTCLTGHVRATISFKKKKRLLIAEIVPQKLRLHMLNFHSFIFKAFTLTNISKYCFLILPSRQFPEPSQNHHKINTWRFLPVNLVYAEWKTKVI